MPRCAAEGDVVRAARSGHWSTELREHATNCTTCGDAALVAAALAREGRRPPRTAEVADARRVWWTARLRARHSSIERATRPIAVVEVAAVGIAALAGAFGLVWAAPLISAVGLSGEWARAGGSVLESLGTAVVTSGTAGIAFWLSLAIAHAAAQDVSGR